MIHLKLRLVLLRVDQRGFRIRMAEERLQLLKRHPGAQADRGEGVPETMRIGMDACTLSYFRDYILQGMGLQLVVRSADADPQGRIAVCA